MHRHHRSAIWLIMLAISSLTFSVPCVVGQQQAVIPHAQDQPPGPALSVREALARMTVPEGFTVEAVAHEPDLVNPVAMTIDERGRFWITESVEYPRRSAGPGKDRIKVLEDTDLDGRTDRVTVFAEGLNIPSGIAVGHGGVWVANAPDILFMRDTDDDGKMDQQEVVVTGFGRDDTHELPNSLTWGPDGWLYGLNGVFNASHIRYPESSPHFRADHPGWKFTCALFRIHPKTREFQVFCEGTSNPWGVAFDQDGSAFISACVIDHLWHLVETGYYHRQGGPYPPFTWKIDSIVKHKHQKAAYCGIHYYDSDAYPEQYRGRLYMGNIHGGCLNVDSLTREGATYFGRGEPDFITANDAWFMPVVQKTGPDGCLYVLDWYDRYHCYQDANRDPSGIDRLKGRLYRIRYQGTPRAPKLDLSQESSEQLVERLNTHNDFIQSTAQRILTERLWNDPQDVVAPLVKQLQQLVLHGPTEQQRAKRRALFLICSLDRIDPAIHWGLLNHDDPIVRAWGVRAFSKLKHKDGTIRQKAAGLARDASADVQLQVAIAASSLDTEEPARVLLNVLDHCGNDRLIPRIVWQNLHPRLEQEGSRVIKLIAERKWQQPANLAQLLPRLSDRLLSKNQDSSEPLVSLIQFVVASPLPDYVAAGQQCLTGLANRIQTGELAGERLEDLQRQLTPVLVPVLEQIESPHPLRLDAALLLTSWHDTRGLASIREVFSENGQPVARRLQALSALIAAKDSGVLEAAERVLSETDSTGLSPAALDARLEFHGQILAGLGRLPDPKVAMVTLPLYPQMAPALQPRLIELLTQRSDWSRQLLAAIQARIVPPSALNVNQIRKLLAFKDQALTDLVTSTWGTLRNERNPQREQVISELRKQLRSQPGDPHAGQKVFARVCGQCHKIYGEGAEVGPDITLNGRSSFEQLLSNVFDPSLVIGAAYQARIVVTTEGRVLTGLVAEDSEQRLVLKVPGGKLETIPRDQIEELTVSPLSMMPEDLEKQLNPQELIDLFAFITLDKPPTDPAARRLPGSTGVTPRESTDPQQYREILSEVAPGFNALDIGEGGVALLAEHFGRPGVVRTHPLNRDKPAVLVRKVTLPADRPSFLLVDVAHHPQGDWRLIVRGNGERLLDEMISQDSTEKGWATFRVDLQKFRGKEVTLQLVNQANDWSYEFGFWGRVEIVTEPSSS